jgi:hypothetical protein
MHPYMRHHHILGFEVPVHDVAIVHFLHTLADLVQFLDGFGLFDAFATFHPCVEGAVFHIFDQHVDVFGIRKVSIQFHQFWVIEEELDLELLDELVHHVPH